MQLKDLVEKVIIKEMVDFKEFSEIQNDQNEKFAIMVNFIIIFNIGRNIQTFWNLILLYGKKEINVLTL